MQKLKLNFNKDHPTAPGHFPGNPIIPGALLLAEVLQLIAQAAGLKIVGCNVQSAKFSSPVLPGESVEIEYEISAQKVISFKCTVGEKTVLAGGISATSIA